jgi:hypothetical protein
MQPEHHKKANAILKTAIKENQAFSSASSICSTETSREDLSAVRETRAVCPETI